MILKIAMICCGSTYFEQGEEDYLDAGGRPLSAIGKRKIEERVHRGGSPEVTLVYAGDSMCCHETASILYPRKPAILTRSLRPFDFGEFSGKTRQELHKNPRFEQWLCSDKAEACPDGENPYEFQARILQMFRTITSEMAAKGIESTSMILHNAAINVILRRYSAPRMGFQDWQLIGGKGYLINFDSQRSMAKTVKLL